MKKLFKLILAITCLLMLTYPTLPVFAEETSSGNNVVNIPDTALKTYLNGQLKQASDADITTEQMAQIKSVTLSGTNYTDLTGLETAVNLETLSISNTNITTLNPIKNQTSLTYLNVSGDAITDSFFPDLNQLTNLQSISVSSKNVTHNIFGKFNKLSKLRYLYAQNSMLITDISALASLENLDTLFLQFDGIDDFRPLNDFASFKNGKLKALAAFGQNTGRTNPRIALKSGKLDYNAADQTLFLPFSMMPNPLTSFDGTVAPFSKSTSASNTYVGFNDVAVASSRLAITDDGITVSGVTKEEFDGLTELEYNARYDFPTGSYPTPPSMSSYTVSSGTYDQYFDISHTLDLTANESIGYNQYTPTTEEQFLKDINAKTDDGTAVQSNFDQVVDFDTPGEYIVTLNAENSAGLKADPVEVKVTVYAKPIITADSSISYKEKTTKTVEEFLAETHSSVTENATLTSDFNDVVDLNTPGEYTVTLNAENERGQKADPVQIIVTVTTKSGVKPAPTPEPPTPLTPEPPTPKKPTSEKPEEKNANKKTVAKDPTKQTPTQTPTQTPKSNLTTKENTVTTTKEVIKTSEQKLPKTGDAGLETWPVAFTSIMLGLTAIILLKKRK
ncbi:LapB repeat-containing protein [Listeria seeligeri]|uniref:LapB repeat-containing protein n=1 Tax=Listeria seeligeri TaxID=1640 RepID=UPI00162A6A7F|nr:LapB repeat-containing protein [Listeria seeligeri]MBC1831107.1 LapB repeat-containing protein [Listeria seeligeri]MBC6130797.1 LapB repeat-containing protein [Listeria seeligeri]MBF2551814.1 LapB repeat-containing protein [Listeria seeligeri]MBF2643443.1 LapB repeat-containing protein [Listeria seeligeri]